MQARDPVDAVISFPARIGVWVLRLDSPHRTWPGAGTLVGVALTTAPLAFRRIYPITAFGLILAAIIGTANCSTTIAFGS